MDYSKTIIYKICSPNTDKIYIGSTLKTLKQRFSAHKIDWGRKVHKKNVTSSILNEYGDAYIELIEIFPCENKSQQRKREGYWIGHYSNIVVNERLAGRTPHEYAKYYREIGSAYQKQREYRENNRELCNEKARQYRETHKEQVKETKRRHREKLKIQKNI